MRKTLCTFTAVVALVLFGATGAMAADAPVDTAWLAGVVAEAGMSVEAPAIQDEAQDPLFLRSDRAPVEKCGVVTCPRGLECCNASCGICVEPGGACIQIVCEHPGGQITPN